MTRYAVIVADPPVPFNTYTGPSLPTRRLRQASAASHYELMSWLAIHALGEHIQAVAADDCALFLWVCNPHIPQMVKVLDSWGFTFKSVAFVWVKLNTKAFTPFSGLGYWTRSNTEQLWLATRGKVERLAKDVRQLQEVFEQPDPTALHLPRHRHSQKPERFQDEIERLVPGPYLELFARRRRPGWACIGNELDGLDITESLALVRDGQPLPRLPAPPFMGIEEAA